MIRLLHTADLHLDAPFPALAEQETERRRDFLKTFERLVTLAIKSEVRLFLVAGDLFDNPQPAAATLGQVQAGFRRLVERGILPVLLPGTHDSVRVTNAVYRREAFPGCVVLDRPLVEEPLRVAIDGTAVYLYGFAYGGGPSAPALASMTRRAGEGVHIGLLHGSRKGSPEWGLRDQDLPFDLATLQGWNLDYVALGHYHDFALIEADGRLLACYPGSPEGKRFGENGPRHAALVTVSSGRAEVERCVVNSRRLEEVRLDLSGCNSLGEVSRKIAALAAPDLLLRLTLHGIVEAPLALERLAAECRGLFFHLELVDATQLCDSDLARRLADEETVRGLFVRRLRTEIEVAEGDRRAVLELALREALVRFRLYGEEAP